MSRSKGYIVVAAAVLMQGCLGGIYAWSAFAVQLTKTAGLARWQTQLVFGTCIALFCLAAIWTGKWQDIYGPRLLAVVSGALIGASYLLAGLLGRQFVFLWLGIGVLGGLGIACGYVCPIATAAKWFPNHKGLVCGLAVAGYGAAAIILSGLAEFLLARGWDVFGVFRLVGVVYGGIVVLAGLLMFLPPGGPSSRQGGMARPALLGQRPFWQLAIGIFCGTLPGLMIIGSLKEIAISRGIAVALAGVSIGALAVGNAAGRISWGFICDRLRGGRTVYLLLGMIAVSVGLAIGVRSHAAAFLAAAALVGFCYGGNFAVYPARVAEVYGVQNLGTVYPLILFSHGLAAGVGPLVGGLSRDRFGMYEPALAIVLAVALLGLALGLVLRDR